MSILFATLGVVILTNPTLIFPWLTESQARSYDLNEYPEFYTGVIIALSGSIASGFAYLSMRRLGTTVHALANPYYFGLFTLPACLIVNFSLGDVFSPDMITWTGIGLLLVTGIFGWIAQEGVSKAMQVEKAGRAAPINYLQVVIAWIADVCFFGASATWTDLLGTFCIVFFTFYGALQKSFTT